MTNSSQVGILDSKARFLSLVDLRDFFRSRVGWAKKSSENDHQLTGRFQSVFFTISRTKSKTSKVNQQSVLNL